jgi:hypothetical protein
MPERIAPGYPPEIEELFNVLWQEVCGFSAKWQLYLDLFADEANLKVVNATAPGAFMLIESALRNDMVMLIGRLTDPHMTGSKPNISLERLIREIKPHAPPELAEQLETDLAAIRTHVTPFKEMRNRKIGHIDMPTALAPVPDPALGISRGHVDQALVMVSKLMNTVSHHFTDTEHMFARVEMPGNGEHLVFYLKAALERFEEEKQRELARYTTT